MENSNLILRVPTLPYDRVPHGRSNELFTFSYTFSAVQHNSWDGDKSPEFEDKTSKTELFIEIDRGHNESGSLVISRNNPKDNTSNYSGGERCGYLELMPISYLQGKLTVSIGGAIYMKSN